jgi:hypothetical protein
VDGFDVPRRVIRRPFLGELRDIVEYDLSLTRERVKALYPSEGIWGLAKKLAAGTAGPCRFIFPVSDEEIERQEERAFKRAQEKS